MIIDMCIQGFMWSSTYTVDVAPNSLILIYGFWTGITNNLHILCKKTDIIYFLCQESARTVPDELQLQMGVTVWGRD